MDRQTGTDDHITCVPKGLTGKHLEGHSSCSSVILCLV